MNHLPTICAISTASGQGAIAVIRVSGSKAISICDTIFVSVVAGKKLVSVAPNTIHYGSIFNDKQLIDEVLVSVFKAPHSFTGEDSVEIACHGSHYIQQQILQLLVRNGAELAQAGEFTMRAFGNGKMDLSQAEAIVDLIAASSAAAHKIALQQMRGGFSNELVKLRDDLLTFVSLIELELDFSEEEVEFANRKQLNELITGIKTKLSRLADSFSVGNAIKNGIPVAIVGETNVGKSTLLNMLLNEDKAIVSDIHGTTRDSIEDTVVLNGITFRFIDTAGIRETTDEIENLGIKRTYEKIAQAEIVLLLVDATTGLELIKSQINHIKELLQGRKPVLVCNKTDLLSQAQVNALETYAFDLVETKILISAKFGTHAEKLQQVLLASAHLSQVNEQEVIVSNIRHYEALVKALEAIVRVEEGLKINVAGDFLSQDIRECMHYLGEITGSIGTEEILGTIFSRFCIGK
ncbi:MAG: tRNA uridine-5-carboxymethylaminomethyl(34) synthesis GTPase MnmE [Paludibacteraceae bacterium]|nr:tRNA uridine-5-carboxymethylaminomethyl(34) synthesis GTPase MnmE [Paludibacteraceae bacterium]MBN2786915.1 tRNA uridine-5-carboxymethylaminomethyl(34) synthesis GTPase MnmE [Paludibacteraceae bacterium]